MRHVLAANLEARGMKAIDIAIECEITPQTISAYRQMDEYKVLVAKIARGAFRASQMRLVDGSQKAADTIIELLDSNNESVRLKAAESLLKMVGMANVEDDIGATTMAEHKAKNMYFMSDLGLMEQVHGETDDYLSQIGVT